MSPAGRKRERERGRERERERERERRREKKRRREKFPVCNRVMWYIVMHAHHA
jgi:hypothetical protein